MLLANFALLLYLNKEEKVVTFYAILCNFDSSTTFDENICN